MRLEKYREAWHLLAANGDAHNDNSPNDNGPLTIHASAEDSWPVPQTLVILRRAAFCPSFLSLLASWVKKFGSTKKAEPGLRLVSRIFGEFSPLYISAGATGPSGIFPNGELRGFTLMNL
jgi:hypothetical protein